MCERVYHAAVVTTQAAERIGYEGWITIMLAGMTILVTLLGIGLAVVAIFGYSGLKESVRDAARTAAQDAAKEISIEDVTAKAVKAALESAQQTIRENKDKWLKEMALGLELPVAESENPKVASNQTEAVSRSYPGEEAKNAGSSDNAGGNNPPAPKDTTS